MNCCLVLFCFNVAGCSFSSTTPCDPSVTQLSSITASGIAPPVTSLHTASQGQMTLQNLKTSNSNNADIGQLDTTAFTEAHKSFPEPEVKESTKMESLFSGINCGNGLPNNQESDKPDYSNDLVQAEIMVAEIDRSIALINSTGRSSTSKAGSQLENRMLQGKLYQLEMNLNKKYAGKVIKWDVMLAKGVIEAENNGEVIVPKWVSGSTGKQIAMNGNTLSKKYVLSVRFKGQWAKGMKRADYVSLNSTIKSVNVSANGVSISLAGGWLSKKELHDKD